MAQLDAVDSALAFHQIAVRITDGGCHWRFFYKGLPVLDYWPAVAKARSAAADAQTLACASAVQAQRVAVMQAERLQKRISELSEPAPEGPGTSQEAPPA